MTVPRIAAAIAGVLTVLLLQAGLVGPLTAPVPVSLPALVVIIVAIYAGPGFGVGLGFSAGLLADLGSDHPAGVQALCWLAAGLIAGKLGGLLNRRGYRNRGVAAAAAGLAGVTSIGSGVLLAVLGSHGATLGQSLRYFVPIVLIDALLGLLLVPALRALLRGLGLRTPRRAVAIVAADRAPIDPQSRLVSHV